MTPSTPSPSAQELADAVDGRIKAGQHVLLHTQQAGWVVAALRRLSATERERDEARRVSAARKTEIERLEQKFMAASGRAAAAEAERDEALEEVSYARAFLKNAESERDALREMLEIAKDERLASENLALRENETIEGLREMLAQADAVIDAAMSVVFSKDLPMPGDPTRVSEALSRHRLSQKG